MYIHVARVEYMYQLAVLHDKDWTVVDSRVAPVKEREQKYVYKVPPPQISISQ